MSIVRIINGKNNELHRMKTMVDYLNDSTKQVWQDEELSEIDLVRSYGVTFENAFLKPYNLVDGSWMYYHPNRLKYGECILQNYIVTHGLVRGG